MSRYIPYQILEDLEKNIKKKIRRNKKKINHTKKHFLKELKNIIL